MEEENNKKENNSDRLSDRIAAVLFLPTIMLCIALVVEAINPPDMPGGPKIMKYIGNSFDSYIEECKKLETHYIELKKEGKTDSLTYRYEAMRSNRFSGLNNQTGVNR